MNSLFPYLRDDPSQSTVRKITVSLVRVPVAVAIPTGLWALAAGVPPLLAIKWAFFIIGWCVFGVASLLLYRRTGVRANETSVKKGTQPKNTTAAREPHNRSPVIIGGQNQQDDEIDPKLSLAVRLFISSAAILGFSFLLEWGIGIGT